MPFSIVARSADGRSYGVAVASKFLAVGAVVPAAEADVGALAATCSSTCGWTTTPIRSRSWPGSWTSTRSCSDGCDQLRPRPL